MSYTSSGIAACLALLFAVPQANAQQKAAPDGQWKPVQDVFGFAGDQLAEGAIRFNMPRKDLHVTLAGIEIKPGLALGAWAAFHRVGKDDAMIMGDLVLTSGEVAPVVKALQEGGVEVTAIHNHLVGESPQILYVHMGGHGDPVQLARAVKQAVSLTKTPMPPGGGGGSESADLGFEVAAVEQAMGHKGKVSGGVLHFNLPRDEKLTEGGMPTPDSMGMGTSINFQPAGSGRAAIAGDFAMAGKEVGQVMRILRENGIESVALHSHSLDDVPRLFYMHFWAVDDAVKLAKGLRAALDRTNTKK